MKIENTIVLYKLIRRSVIFLSLLICAWLLLFLMGNFQHFMDSTQRTLLTVTSCIGIGHSLFCFFAMILSVLLFFQKRNKGIFIQTGVFFILGVFSITVTLFSSTINFISQGI